MLIGIRLQDHAIISIIFFGSENHLPWSVQEVEAVVASYLEMLAAELTEVAYSKAVARRRLAPLLRDRSNGAIEFKFCNISAVLIELSFPYISGYKPRWNYQRLLFDVVAQQLAINRNMHQVAERDVESSIVIPAVEDILRAWSDPPSQRGKVRKIAEPSRPYIPLPVNYLEREARNRAMGLEGEKFVIKFEQARLIRDGRDDLAGNVEHIAETKGDGEGFDVLSFDRSGRERLIEVKTTKYGKETPFYVSRNELVVSEEQAKQYFLYRVYEFRKMPKLFGLKGALSSTCMLDAASYVARVA